MKQRVQNWLRWLQYKAYKRWLIFAGSRIGRYVIRVGRRTWKAASVAATLAVIGIVIVHSSVPVSAQSMAIDNRQLSDGTAPFNGINLTSNGSALQLQRGDIGSWQYGDGTQLLPTNIYDDSAMVTGPNGAQYIMTAMDSQCQFYRYDTELQKYDPVQRPPEGCGSGMQLAYDGSSTLYYQPANNSFSLYSYNIASDTWKKLANLPAQVGRGGSTSYAVQNGKGYLFTLRGLGSASFWKYDISANTWTGLTAFPTVSNVNSGVSSCWDGGDTIYVISDVEGEFKKYSIAAGTWTAISRTFSNYQRHRLQFISGKVVDFQLNWSSERTSMSSYDTVTNAWTSLPRPPVGGHQYDGVVPFSYDGQRYGYVLIGSDVQISPYRFDFQTGQWDAETLYDQTLDDTAHRYGMVYDGVQSIYFLAGKFYNNADRLYKYDIISGVTTRIGTQISTPSGYSGFAGTYYNGNLYYLGAESSTAFQRFDTTSLTWTTLTNAPANAGSGASIVDGGNGSLYATFANSTAFWRYNVSANSWTQLTSVPEAVAAGGGLTRIGSFIYEQAGNSSGRFNKYSIASGTWANVRDFPNGRVDHGGFITSDGSRYVYSSPGNRTDPQNRRFFRYDSQNDTWSRMADIPSATQVNSAAIYDTVRNRIMLSAGTRSARLYQYTPSSAAYVTSGTWYSKPLDLKQVQTWTQLQSTVNGSGATFYIRTSDNPRIWSEWSQVVSGSISATPARYAQLKVVLSGNGTATPTVSGLQIDYDREAAAPSPPSVFTATKDATDTTPLVSGQRYEYQHPVFNWGGASDGNRGSGVDGYYVYFGVDSTADPVTDGSYQTGTSYTVSTAMSAGSVYYTRIKVKDKLGNISPAATYFSYLYFYISPPGSVVKTSDSDFNEGTNSGVSVAGGAMQLQQQAKGAWNVGTMEQTPDSTRSPAMQVVDDSLYVMRGNNTTAFWRYNLTNQVWETLAPLPQASSDGSSMVWDKGNYLYAMRGNNTSDGFYRYNIQTNAWEILSALPANASYGSDMAFLDSGRIAFMFANSREFYIYDIASRTFSIKAALPSSISTAGSGIWFDGNDSVYAYQGYYFNGTSGQSNRETLVKYSIQSDSWRTLSSSPYIPAYAQNNLVGDGHGGLYVFGSSYINNSPANVRAQRYDIATDTWKMVSNYPGQSLYGSATSDNNRFIYIIPTNWAANTRKIIRYDTWDDRFDSDTVAPSGWQRLPWDDPINTYQWQQGTATTGVYDGSKYVYIIGADEGPSQLLRYDPTNGDSTYLPPPPAVGYGGSMTILNGSLYYLPGRATTWFYKYDMVNQQWQRLADPLATVYRPGSSTLIPLSDGTLFALRGNTSNTAYRFTPGGGGDGTWTSLANVPSNVLTGSAVYDKDNNYVYVLPANNTSNFYRYNVAANTWSTMANLPATTSYGSAMAIKNGKIYTAQGNITRNAYVYDISSNTWSVGSRTAEEMRTAAQFIPINDDYLLSLSGDDAADFYKFNYPGTGKAYAGIATHISQPMPISGIFDYAGIQAQVDMPANTNIEFFTHTSTDGVNWDGWKRTTDVKKYDNLMSSRIASSAKRYVQVKIVLSSYDNLYTPTVNSYALDYYSDVDPPTNPNVIKVYSNSSKQTELSSNTWYNHANAHFDWPEPGEAGGATDGPLGSRIAGYWVYLGTDPTASPRTSGTFIPLTEYTANLSQPGTYYIRIQAQDVTGNVDPAVFASFIYKFDNSPPTTPTLITVNPSGFTARNNYSFNWPNAFDANSGISKYCYHTGATSGPFAAEVCQDGREINNISAAYQAGTNVFYVRTLDAAGNYSSSYTTASFYYSTDPPGPVSNLRAVPPSSAQNLFTFIWDLPAVFAGDPDRLQYCYSINILPSSLNTTCTTERFVPAFKAATQQGTNIMYMVAKDEAGNANWNTYASANFIANTVSPGIPLNLVVTDSSDRLSNRWSLTSTWDKPTFEGNGIDGYIIERSEDGHSFEQIGRTSNRAYVDLDVEPSKPYYYRVRAADNVDNRGGASGVVSRTAQGAFGTPPRIVSPPKATVGFDQAVIDWVTDRESTSFVYYGSTPTSLGQSKGALNVVTTHGLSLTGLQPSTTYYYRVQSFDNERSYSLNDAYSQIYSFRTSEAARTYNVSASDLTFNSAGINWQTSVPTKARIEYGNSLDYGNSTDLDSPTFGTNHFMRLGQLQSGTTYHYRIVATTEFGSTITSDDYTFDTVPRPTISNIRFQPLPDEVSSSVRVSWTTNVPTSSTVNYQALGVLLEQSESKLVTEHDIVLKDLAGSTTYRITVEGRDQYGNLTTSDAQTWESTVDTRPPKISDVSMSVTTTEGSSGTKAQMIVSWKTDEPATSQIFYDRYNASKLAKQTPLDTEPTTNHVVIISNLTLADMYKVRIASKDILGNQSQGSPTTVVTPDREASVLDSVLTILQKVFRF